MSFAEAIIFLSTLVIPYLTQENVCPWSCFGTWRVGSTLIQTFRPISASLTMYFFFFFHGREKKGEQKKASKHGTIWKCKEDDEGRKKEGKKKKGRPNHIFSLQKTADRLEWSGTTKEIKTLKNEKRVLWSLTVSYFLLCSLTALSLSVCAWMCILSSFLSLVCTQHCTWCVCEMCSSTLEKEGPMMGHWVSY